MNRRWDQACDTALRVAYRQAVGRATRPAVVESTPALESELLWLLTHYAGGATLARVFGRHNDLSWPQDAPTWALLAATNLLIDKLVEPDPKMPAKYVITEAGWLRVGRPRNQGDRS